jgi:hypothetical protein
MKWTTVKQVLAGGLLAIALASVAGCYPYWQYRDSNSYRGDGYHSYDRYNRYDWRRDYGR